MLYVLWWVLFSVSVFALLCAVDHFGRKIFLGGPSLIDDLMNATRQIFGGLAQISGGQREIEGPSSGHYERIEDHPTIQGHLVKLQDVRLYLAKLEREESALDADHPNRAGIEILRQSAEDREKELLRQIDEDRLMILAKEWEDTP